MIKREGANAIQINSRKGSVENQIFRAITEKGWALYFLGSRRGEIFQAEMFRRGPVDSLEVGVFYGILPRVNDPFSKTAIGRFIRRYRFALPRVTLPVDEFRYLDRVKYQSLREGECEELLKPGNEIRLIEIELRVIDIKIVSERGETQCTITMPYSVFQRALESLRDINKLADVGKRVLKDAS